MTLSTNGRDGGEVCDMDVRLFWGKLAKYNRGGWAIRGPQYLLVASLSEGACKPLQTFVETISRCGASGLDVLSAC